MAKEELNFGGFAVVVDTALDIGKLYKDNGFNYELHVRHELERLIPRSKVFWDIGANAGMHSVSAKSLNPDLQVVCFEPSPHNVDSLLATMRLNGWLDTIVMPVAVSNFNGLLPTNCCVDNPTTAADHKLSDAYPEVFPCVKLDSLSLPMPDVVKMDVEGCEFEVLEGGFKVLDCKPTWIFEYNTPLLRPRGKHIAIIDAFIEAGYKVTVLEYWPGMRREVKSGQECYDHVMATSGHIADVMCEPL